MVCGKRASDVVFQGKQTCDSPSLSGAAQAAGHTRKECRIQVWCQNKTRRDRTPEVDVVTPREKVRDRNQTTPRNQKLLRVLWHADPDNEGSFSAGYAFLQETGAVDKAAVGIGNGEEREVCLRRREALSRKTNSDVHRARRDAGFRKIRSETGEASLADKRPLNIYEELALGEAYLRSKRK